MRVLVMNMQASGADRRAIEQQLRRSFGIQDPAALLSEMLPTGSRAR
jgi:hypothetical protein